MNADLQGQGLQTAQHVRIGIAPQQGRLETDKRDVPHGGRAAHEWGCHLGVHGLDKENQRSGEEDGGDPRPGAQPLDQGRCAAMLFRSFRNLHGRTLISRLRDQPAVCAVEVKRTSAVRMN